MIARIQIGDVVMKPSGAGWVVGRPVRRVIKGRETEEVVESSYFSTAAIAIPYFLGRASRVPRSADNAESELIRLFSGEGEPGIRLTLLYALTAPDAVTRALRGEETLAGFSRRCGVSRRALRDIEAGESNPRTDTLLRIVVAGLQDPP